MNSLDLLVEANILDEDYYPLMKPADVKRSKAVIFQKYCLNGVHYDVMISWLQKAIRRNLNQQALYCVVWLTEMNGIFLSHTLNRLLTILSEDIGMAESGLAKLVYTAYTGIWKRRKSKGDLCEENKGAFLEIVNEFSRAKHSRYTDEIMHWCELTQLELADYSVQAFRDYLAAGDYEKASAIVIEVHDSKEQISGGCVASGRRKRLKVFRYWDVLLEHVNDNEDIHYLFKLYENTFFARFFCLSHS